MEIKRVDAWLIKGFDGITNLVIQKSSQGKITKEIKALLELAIRNLELGVALANAREPTLNSDRHMCSSLLHLSKIFLDRVIEDNGFDGASISLMREYLLTLNTALMRFKSE